MISSQHAKDISLDGMLAPDLRKHVLEVVLEEYGFDSENVRFLVNPTGKFEIGGPMGDAGLTGRKIIVDTYGGMARHGGGAFSGKDPSKVDRSAAYAMRWVAKNVVAAGLADRCEVQVAYAIGKAHPVGLFVETFGTETVPTERIAAAVLEAFDLRPAAIIRDLDLKRPIFRPRLRTATSAGNCPSSPGNGPTAPRHWRRPSRADRTVRSTSADRTPRRTQAPGAATGRGVRGRPAGRRPGGQPAPAPGPVVHLCGPRSGVGRRRRRGCRVRVRLAGQLVEGFVGGDTAPRTSPGLVGRPWIGRVVRSRCSPRRSARCAGGGTIITPGSVSDVLRLAVPPRVAGAEAGWSDRPGA